MKAQGCRLKQANLQKGLEKYASLIQLKLFLSRKGRRFSPDFAERQNLYHKTRNLILSHRFRRVFRRERKEVASAFTLIFG